MGPNFQWNDDSDYGVPILQIPSRTRAQRIKLTYHRYRTTILVTIGIIFFLYWTKGSSHETIDWSRVAYVQYATDTHSLCNSLMIFESLRRLGSKASRVLLYPDVWDSRTGAWDDRNLLMLKTAERRYRVKLQPVQLLSTDGPTEPGSLGVPSGYGSSMTKLRLFELEQYDRVLYFDGDSVLQQHLDELFSLPATPMAMPRAYWSEKPRESWPLSSTLMLIQPSLAETKHLFSTLQYWRLSPDMDESRHYDEELINDRFGSSALVLPHNPYLLHTNEFRTEDHTRWLGLYNAPPSSLRWDAPRAIREAKLVHFNDWPLPKPWVMWPDAGLKELQPSCRGMGESCEEREIWKHLYEDFRRRRKDICKLLPAPAPTDWEEYKNRTGAL